MKEKKQISLQTQGDGTSGDVDDGGSKLASDLNRPKRPRLTVTAGE